MLVTVGVEFYNEWTVKAGRDGRLCRRWCFFDDHPEIRPKLPNPNSVAMKPNIHENSPTRKTATQRIDSSCGGHRSHHSVQEGESTGGCAGDWAAPHDERQRCALAIAYLERQAGLCQQHLQQ